MSSDPETALWSEVKQSGAKEYYEAYLGQYPKGKYAALARTELKKLDEREKAEKAKEEAERKAQLAREEAERKATAEREKQEQARQEQEAWERAKTQDDLAAYERYLADYPKGRFVVLAKAALPRVQREAAEREKQEAARREREAKEAERQRLAAEREAADRAQREALERERQEQARRERDAREAERLAKEAAELRPGKVFKDCADCPEMVLIPGGIAIGRTEVTQGQWRSVMGNNPSYFSSCGDTCPVEQVSWDDAQEFVRKISQKTGKTYRLPSEEEWERACRAGGQQEYCGSDNIDSVAWHRGNSSGKTQPVAGKQPNAWGLYDMTGNVWEWTDSCYGKDCSVRVLRGGSWSNFPQNVRAAFRSRFTTGIRLDGIGFRLARTLLP